MTDDPREVADRQRRFGRLAKAVGLRIVFFGGLAVLALVMVADVGSLMPNWATGPPPADELSGEATGPGWPHRRGPHYDAVSDETDLANSWPPEGPPVLWSLELGRSYSGFIAIGNRVFTQTQTLTRQSVVCLNADSGSEIWRYGYGWPYEAAGLYPGPRSTPTWHDGRIYFTGPRGVAGCLTADDGQLTWQVDFDARFTGRGTEFGYACSPLIEDGRVILPVGGEGASVVALSAHDGSTAWASGDAPASYCSALPITFRGRRLVVAFLENALTLFDLQTGQQLCEEKLSWGYNEHAAAPLYDEPYLMIACPFRSGAECYRIEADDADADNTGDAKPQKLSLKSVWNSPEMSNDTASSVLVDGHVYGFDLRDIQAKSHRPSRGKFKCLELTTGKVCWESDAPGHATVIAADGKLVLLSDKGELLLAAASPKQYEELARAQVFSDEICWTAPALHRGRLYLRSPTKAACVYIGRPEDLDQQRLQGAVSTSEISQQRRLDLRWLAGGEREYVMDLPDLAELWRWYAYSIVGVLLPAAVIGVLVQLLVNLRWPAAANRYGRSAFWCIAFLFGAFGTAVYHQMCNEFVFTWVVSLAVAHQVVLNTVVRSQQRTEVKQVRGSAALATIFFLGVCLGYFLLCRRFSMAVQWPFLLGFLPAWPIAVPAAYRLREQGHPLRDFLWTTASFSVHFWAVGGFLLWKAAMHTA